MPEDRRPPCADVVDQFVPVQIPDVRAFRPLDEERLSAHAAKGAHGGIDAAGNELAGFGEGSMGAGVNGHGKWKIILRPRTPFCGSRQFVRHVPVGRPYAEGVPGEWQRRLRRASTFSRLRANVRIVKALPLFLCALFLRAAAHASTSGAVIRETGGIYLEDLLQKPVRLATISEAPIYYKIDLQRYLGTLKKGQLVELQAISDTAYRVRGIAQQGQVVGWVEAKYLNPLKKEFVENLKKNEARRLAVLALIAKREVAINMTPEEVSLALGKPTKTISRVDASGREDVWEYIRYERVAQQQVGRDGFGNLVTTVVYVKVPVGKLSVTFANALVATLEQSEGSLAKDAHASVVQAPFVIAN